MVDTLGLLLVIVVHSAAIQNRNGIRLVFAGVKNRWLYSETGLRCKIPKFFDANHAKYRETDEKV